MKRRTKVIALATSLLVGVSMMGVGFASWVISATKTGDATGNVKAEAVSDNTITFEVSTASNIVFGNAANATEGWLKNDNSQATESLSAEFTLTFKSGTLSSLSHSTIQYAFAGEGSNTGWNFQSAIDKGYITAPTYSLATNDYGITYTGGNFSVASPVVCDTTGISLTFTVTFGWGALFNGSNPQNFFNAKASGTAMSEYGANYTGEGTYAREGKTTNTEYALEVLGDMYTLLGGESGTNYTITFTANSNG